MGSIDTLFGLAHDVIDAFDEIIPQPDRPRSPTPASTPTSTSPASASAAHTSHAPTAASAATSGQRTGAALVRRMGRFRVVEAISEAGETVWVVTDGIDRAECSSGSFAERVRAALG